MILGKLFPRQPPKITGLVIDSGHPAHDTEDLRRAREPEYPGERQHRSPAAQRAGFLVEGQPQEDPCGFTGRSRRAVCLHRRASRALRFSGSSRSSASIPRKRSSWATSRTPARPGIDSRWRSRTTTSAPSQMGSPFPTGSTTSRPTAHPIFVGILA